jgi:hypothetical protein
MRWTGKPLNETSLILEAGGVGTLRLVADLRYMTRSSPLASRRVVIEPSLNDP